jgi:putative effector of murein hydrolase LrgA (UPF0299 family)
MIRALALLLICQLAGEVFARTLALPVPGPVIGLTLLAIGAMIRASMTGTDASEIEDTDLGKAASALLGSLGLLFVPAGVGIMQQLPLIASCVLQIVAALLISTILTLLVTVYVFILVKRMSPRASQDINL